MLADELDYVIGVDTHRDQHALAVVTVPAGALVAGSEIAASNDGYKAALRGLFDSSGSFRSVARQGPSERFQTFPPADSCSPTLALSIARE
jgi:hypothetical protein